VKASPAGLGSAGKTLWRSILRVYELNPAELLLLERACRCADRLASIDTLIAASKPLVVGSVGQVRPNPLYRQALEADAMLSKLLTDLHLPGEVSTVVERDVVRLRQRRIGMAG
jgi:hypothetical protein